MRRVVSIAAALLTSIGVVAVPSSAQAAVRPEITLRVQTQVVLASRYDWRGVIRGTGARDDKTVLAQVWSPSARKWLTVVTKKGQDDGAYALRVAAPPRPGTYSLRTLVKRGTVTLDKSPTRRINVLPAPPPPPPPPPSLPPLPALRQHSARGAGLSTMSNSTWGALDCSIEFFRVDAPLSVHGTGWVWWRPHTFWWDYDAGHWVAGGVGGWEYSYANQYGETAGSWYDEFNRRSGAQGWSVRSNTTWAVYNQVYADGDWAEGGVSHQYGMTNMPYWCSTF